MFWHVDVVLALYLVIRSLNWLSASFWSGTKCICAFSIQYSTMHSCLLQSKELGFHRQKSSIIKVHTTDTVSISV